MKSNDPSLTLKLKRPGLYSIGNTFRELAEEIPDIVKEFDVGGGIGAGSSSNRSLIDCNHFVDEVNPFYFLMLAHGKSRIVQNDSKERGIKDQKSAKISQSQKRLSLQ